MTASDSAETPQEDPEIQARFVEAYDILKPFFDPANAWVGHTHEHLAYLALHEHFPDLPPEEIAIIVAAAKRVFGTAGETEYN
jgi:hypothetical protein